MTGKKLKEFYTYLGSVYDEERFVHISGWGKARRSFINKLLKKYAQSGVWLDLGCGGGVFLSEMSKLNTRVVIGADIALPALMRASAANSQSDLICCDAEILPLSGSSITLLLCSETIEHLEHPELLLSECARVLMNNGILILTCPNWKKSRPERVDVGILRHFGAAEKNYIHTAFQPQELDEMAAKCGLTILESGSFEKEMRIWGRFHDAIGNAVIRLAEAIHFHDGMIRMIYRLQSFTGGLCFEILRIAGIARLMRGFFRGGPRSFIVAMKK